ncbi:MAG: SDR family oxidoreductase [Pseudomonadota bacterium]
MNEPEALGGKVAIVTGASSGIGEATARRLRSLGMNVVMFARRAERLNALQADLGDGCYPVIGDVNDEAAVSSLIPKALEVFGACDVVINNAGAFAAGPTEKLNAGEVRRLARTNVESAYHVAFEAISHFKAQSHGDLINVSSISGTKVARAGIGWYAGTKHALEALTESLRMEVGGTDVRVNCIEPGMTQTEIFGEPITSIENPLQPEDIAAVIESVLRQPRHVTIPRLMILPSSQSI